MAGIDKDNVLGVLTEDTTVMHDHNTLNYNKKFKFKNIECNCISWSMAYQGGTGDKVWGARSKGSFWTKRGEQKKSRTG